MIDELKRDKSRLFTLLFYPFYLISWFVIQGFISYDKVYIIHCAIDDMIPLCEFFVVFYCAWFIYYAATVILYLFKSREDFLRLSAMLIFGIVISIFIFCFFQNSIDFRPAAAPDNFFGRLVNIIYQIDPPRSVCPSLHCYVSICITISVFKSQKYKKFTIPSAVLSILICLSTFFIKQHSVIDCGAALILAVPAYFIAYHLIKIKEKVQ